MPFRRQEQLLSTLKTAIHRRLLWCTKVHMTEGTVWRREGDCALTNSISKWDPGIRDWTWVLRLVWPGLFHLKSLAGPRLQILKSFEEILSWRCGSVKQIWLVRTTSLLRKGEDRFVWNDFQNISNRKLLFKTRKEHLTIKKIHLEWTVK